MSDHHIQLCLLAVQFAGLVGLAWYAFETYGLRKAAQDQIEALSMPYLTLLSEQRDAGDTILARHGAVGTLQAKVDQGNYAVRNIGSGVALNIRYRFVTEEEGKFQPGYVQHIAIGQPMPIPEALITYQGKASLVFLYESLGGRKYETIVTIDRTVLTGSTFTPLR
jgi:hypothetical protein